MMSPSMAENPFVGLRPFSSEDSLYYFGRNEQTRALLGQLDASRFLAVVGASGSGKSSLVRAGLIPILESGFLVQERDRWEIATMRPGATPIANLAEALTGMPGATGDAEDVGGLVDRIGSRGAAAILERVLPALEGRQANLLLLVDQFEELYRFASSPAEREEAADFVSILLSLAAQPGMRIYVVLTMRSDFIGDCDRFQGLPEAMNRSQYLVPRLTRQQRREAIGGPVRLAGGTTAPRLLDKLLNENIDTRDDLPILQHALMRTWENWAASGREGPLDLKHLEAIGGIAEALNNHADEALSELSASDQLLAKRLFEALTETDSGNRMIRRPAYISEIAGVAGASLEQIERVIDPFREHGRSFLVRTRKPGRDDVLVDISHESLIRQWNRLHGWVEEEAESAKTYRRLAETADLHERGRADIYRGIDLELAGEWKDEAKPTRAWGIRYHPRFDSAMAFLAESQKAHDDELARAATMKRRRLLTVCSMVLLVMTLLSAIAIYAWGRKREAEGRHRLANYHVAKAVAQDATAALERMQAQGPATLDYQLAWLSALVSLNQRNLPEGSSFPESLGILSRWDLVAGSLINLWTSPRGDSAQRCAVFSPDGNYIVTGTQGGALTLWHQPSSEGPPVRIPDAFPKGEGIVYALAFHPSGKILATGQGRTVRLWNFAEPTKPVEFLPPLSGFERDVRGLAFSSDGSRLAVGSEDASVRLWDLSDPAAPRELESPGKHDGPVYDVAFSPDRKTLASASEDRTIRLWDLSGATPPAHRTLLGHPDSVGSIAFHPDGHLLASAGRETSIRLWDLSKTDEFAQLDPIENAHSETVNQIAFSPDGKTLASASLDRSIGLWDLTAPTRPQRRMIFQGHKSFAFTAAFHPDRALLLSASDDKTIRLWDLTDPRDMQRATGHSHFVNSIAISRDGRILASASRDNSLGLWDLSRPKPLNLTFLRGQHLDNIYSVAISPDGKTLASGSRDKSIRIFSLENPANPELLATVAGDESGAKGHFSWVLALAFSADGKLLASGSHDMTLRVWDLTNPANPLPTRFIKQFDSWVSTVSFSPKGRTLAAGAYDKTIRLYDLSNPDASLELARSPVQEREVTSVCFSPAGGVLASAAFDGALCLWKVNDPNELVEVARWSGNSTAAFSIAFSPDGKTLAAGFSDKTIGLWDIAHPGAIREAAVLRGHTDSISSVVFTPDGGALVSGSRDRTIRRWNLDGPLADYRRAGIDAPSFQSLYRRSFELLGFRLEGFTIVTEQPAGENGVREALRYRPPGSNPLPVLLEGATAR